MNIKDATELLKVIADESRLRIIKALEKEKKICGNDLLAKVECKQATLSHHMSVLEEAGLVKAKRNGNKIFYSLIKTSLVSLGNFLGAEKPAQETKAVETKEEIKVEPVKEVVKILETSNPKPVETKEEKKSPVVISVPIYLL